MLKDVKTDWLF